MYANSFEWVCSHHPPEGFISLHSSAKSAPTTDCARCQVVELAALAHSTTHRQPSGECDVPVVSAPVLCRVCAVPMRASGVERGVPVAPSPRCCCRLAVSSSQSAGGEKDTAHAGGTGEPIRNDETRQGRHAALLRHLNAPRADRERCCKSRPTVDSSQPPLQGTSALGQYKRGMPAGAHLSATRLDQGACHAACYSTAVFLTSPFFFLLPRVSRPSSICVFLSFQLVSGPSSIRSDPSCGSGSSSSA
jgi:hypothetical protein